MLWNNISFQGWNNVRFQGWNVRFQCWNNVKFQHWKIRFQCWNKIRLQHWNNIIFQHRFILTKLNVFSMLWFDIVSTCICLLGYKWHVNKHKRSVNPLYFSHIQVELKLFKRWKIWIPFFSCTKDQGDFVQNNIRTFIFWLLFVYTSSYYTYIFDHCIFSAKLERMKPWPQIMCVFSTHFTFINKQFSLRSFLLFFFTLEKSI